MPSTAPTPGQRLQELAQERNEDNPALVGELQTRC